MVPWLQLRRHNYLILQVHKRVKDRKAANGEERVQLRKNAQNVKDRQEQDHMNVREMEK